MYEMYDGPLYNYVHFVIVLETKLLIKYLWLGNNLETNWSVLLKIRIRRKAIFIQN